METRSITAILFNVVLHMYRLYTCTYKEDMQLGAILIWQRAPDAQFQLMFSSFPFWSRQIRTLIVAVVGVGVFSLNQGSPVWLQQRPSSPPHCIPSRGDHWCAIRMVVSYNRLVIQTHSSSCCQHMMEDWYLVVCYMDSLLHGLHLTFHDQQRMSIHVDLVDYRKIWKHHSVVD